jgi:hypothetical protein
MLHNIATKLRRYAGALPQWELERMALEVAQAAGRDTPTAADLAQVREEKASKSVSVLVEELNKALHEGKGADKRLGTLWGIYNAVTWYATHETIVRASSENGDEAAARGYSTIKGAERAIIQQVNGFVQHAAILHQVLP